MNKLIIPAVAAALISLSTIPSYAGARDFSCANASGEMTYDGTELTYRSAESPTKTTKVKSHKISETLIATSEETCVTKSGAKFVAGSKTS